MSHCPVAPATCCGRAFTFDRRARAISRVFASRQHTPKPSAITALPTIVPFLTRITSGATQRHIIPTFPPSRISNETLHATDIHPTFCLPQLTPPDVDALCSPVGQAHQAYRIGSSARIRRATHAGSQAARRTCVTLPGPRPASRWLAYDRRVLEPSSLVLARHSHTRLALLLRRRLLPLCWRRGERRCRPQPLPFPLLARADSRHLGRGQVQGTPHRAHANG